MTSEELIKRALELYDRGRVDSHGLELAKVALLAAIAQELKRANDNAEFNELMILTEENRRTQ